MNKNSLGINMVPNNYLFDINLKSVTIEHIHPIEIKILIRTSKIR